MELKTPESEEKQNGGDKETAKDKHRNRRKAAQILIIVGIIDSASLVLWAKSEDFSHPVDYYIRWIGYCGLLVGCAFGFHKLLKLNRRKIKKRTIALIWGSWAICCVALFFTKSAQSTALTEKTWEPPELPKDCKDVVIWFGSQGMIYKMEWLTNYPFAPGVTTSVPISNLPKGVRTNLPNIPGFSPHLKNVLGFFAVSNRINGKIEDYYPVLPQVVSNRLYVFVKIPLTNYQRIVMSDEMDSVLTNCLPQSPGFWDWNYSRNPKTNIFEIVNENKNPIVQVIYKSPREVLVNGVFFVSHYDIQATFDGKNPGYFLIQNVKTNMPSDSLGVALTNQFGGIIFTNQPPPGKHQLPFYQVNFGATNLILSLMVEDVYAGFSTNQKSIFKYPSNIFPGEFAPMDKPAGKPDFKLALIIEWTIIGGGILWMCVGWFFFQKRI